MSKPRRRDRGQSLVEFSLVLIPFLLILMGIIDLGRGIYTYNGVAQAARELARATSVHTCDTTKANCTLGTSPETADVRGTQNTMVPGPRRWHGERDLHLHLDHRRDALERQLPVRVVREGHGLGPVPGDHPRPEHGGADDPVVDDPHRDPVKEPLAMRTNDRPRERGQMLALFAICLVAIIAMTGLVIDGGMTMVQRREQQNVADAAAMAGAYSFANTSNATTAAGQAQANAAANGYANGVGNVVVTVDVTTERRRGDRHDDGQQAAPQLLLRDPGLRRAGT